MTNVSAGKKEYDARVKDFFFFHGVNDQVFSKKSSICRNRIGYVLFLRMTQLSYFFLGHCPYFFTDIMDVEIRRHFEEAIIKLPCGRPRYTDPNGHPISVSEVKIRSQLKVKRC